MACECVSCPECQGSGTVWYAFPGPDMGGEYLGNNRCDDLDHLDTCPECDGSGIVEVCYECMVSQDDEDY